ncbi:hypothetical protein [Halodesulfovibrio aestuarii]|uniref:DUF4823 domain-containing protein n=1 Tax=Halodesulfovibrio aestuarii TaxID=126333 RepID=A0A8G2CBP6_9BACT|nr:hypothetical protein [Halodesulfovibrio aestuarii]SHJ61527.1 hypothetical protein SAMN05660830_02843 [Halodesulfovibrio aestuarii]
MHKHLRHTGLILCLVGLFMVGGCAKPTPPAQLPPLAMGLANFTQPTTTGELLAGYIPSDQFKVSAETLDKLNADFEKLLMTETTRVYTSGAAASQCYEITTAQHREDPLNALQFWNQVGICMKADVLIIPQVIDWTPREGGNMGAFQSAGVNMDFYTLRVDAEEPSISRFHFEETQESLSENLLNIKKWFKRKGHWITAEQLAEEGMRQAITELGL